MRTGDGEKAGNAGRGQKEMALRNPSDRKEQKFYNATKDILDYKLIKPLLRWEV